MMIQNLVVLALLTAAPAVDNNGTTLKTGDWIEHGFTQQQRNDIRAAFQRGIDRRVIPGGALMLIHKGEVIFREAFGVADVNTGLAFKVDSPCRIASLTKPHAATVLVMLAEKGLLSLDDPVDKYLPAFKSVRVRGKGAAKQAPTIAQCLSHTTGFPGNNALKAGKFKVNLDGTLADVVADLATKELLAEPGTRYAYSRLGYMTAARVAEVVTEKEFPDVMNEVLLQPISATESMFYPPTEELRKRMPVVYERTKDGFRPRQGEPLGKALNPGGQLIATLDGVARLMLLHRNRGQVGGKQLVSEKALAAMYVPQPGSTGTGYGLGFNILQKRDDGTARRIRHTGASGTLAMIDFDTDLIVIVLTQVPQVQTNGWRRPLLKTIEDVF